MVLNLKKMEEELDEVLAWLESKRAEISEEKLKEFNKLFTKTDYNNGMPYKYIHGSYEEIIKWVAENFGGQIESDVIPKTEVYSGKITISRATSNVEDDYMNIEIKTEKLRIRCKMSMKDYAFAISGLSMQPLDVEIR